MNQNRGDSVPTERKKERKKGKTEVEPANDVKID